ncbi:MAG: hypothetical protein U9R06_01500 [Patescibacteria group bacterium]|nr:hypothetical protein [Patescibacteria group bacterium]
MNETMRETMLRYLEITAKAAGFGEPKDISEIIGAIIGTFLSLLGVIFLILIMHGGFVWMTSGGNENKVLKAKQTLTRAIVGLIIILGAYSITAFVFHAILQ